MEWDEVQRQIPIATLNIVINKFTEHEAVEHGFLVERWHEIESVLWNAKLVLKQHDDVETVARSVAENAVKYEMLHHSLLEHAVLHVRHKLDDDSRTDTDQRCSA